MKKIVLIAFAASCFTIGVQAQTKHTINISGFAYAPSELTIMVGDEVTIVATPNHPLLEVSEATWNVGGTTALAGGFSGTTSQTVTFPKAGVYYYVCTRHAASQNMKGKITVTSPTGLFNESSSTSNNGVKIYPNPAVSDLMIQLEQATQVQNISMVNAQGIEVSNQAINSTISSHTLNVSGFESGLYQVVISTSEKKIYNKVVVR